MKYLTIAMNDEDYELLKKYAKATRKYETGSGFTIKSAIELMIKIGLDPEKNKSPVAAGPRRMRG